MELNRNHYFMIGVVVLLLGLQLRMVESYILNDHASEFVATRLSSEHDHAPAMGSFSLTSSGPKQGKVIKPPTWLGWALISVGTVLILHSLAMKKPG